MTRGPYRRWFRLPPVSRSRLHQEIDEELDAHLQAWTEYNVARGMTEEDARAEALRRFGDFEAGRASLHAQAIGHVRRRQLRDRADDLLQDVRYVMRGMFRSRAVSAGIVTTFAIGLGINASVFRIADHVLLRAPEGVVDARDVRRVESSLQFSGNSAVPGAVFSWPDTRALANTNVARISVYSTPRRVSIGDNDRDVSVTSVDSGYFHLLGAAPAIGRRFAASETEPGAGIAVAIVSWTYWKSELGGSALAPSTRVVLDGRSYQVIGVMPSGFAGIELDPIDVWLPLGIGNLGRTTINGVEIPWYRSEMGRPLRMMARLRPDVPEERAVATLSAALGAKDRDADLPPRTVRLQPVVPAGDHDRIESTIHLLRRLSAVAGMILFIACANATNLLLARGLRRRQEIGVRLALGASRMRIVRLLLIESVTLGACGGMAATVTGYWTGESLRRMLFPDSRWTTAPFDGRVVAFTLLLTVIAGVAAGVAPALQLSSPDLSLALKARPGRGRVRITRMGLVVLQTAFTLALLVASGLLMRSLQQLNRVQLGYRPENLITAGLERASGDAGALAARLTNDAAIASMALATSPPIGTIQRTTMSVPGSDYNPESSEAPFWNAVTPNFFDVTGTHLLRGRTFNARDVLGAEPVVIVNHAFASRYWQGPIPDGACVLTYMTGCARVVGVVEDMRDAQSSNDPPMRFYLPLSQVGIPPAALVIRTQPGRVGAVVQSVRAAIPRAGKPEILVLNDIVKRAARPWNVATMLFSGLGAIALVLAWVGTYSVMTYLASERVHEIGVRMVLGASMYDVLLLMLQEGMKLVLIGSTVGLAAAAGGADLLDSLLFGISPHDPLVYVVSFVGLATMALAAVLVPAMRAAHTDPVAAIRVE